MDDDERDEASLTLGILLGFFTTSAKMKFLNDLGATQQTIDTCRAALTGLITEIRAHADAHVDVMTAAVRNGICPDCNWQGLTLGPCGGASMNVECPRCGARYNAHGANIGGMKNLRMTILAQRLDRHLDG